MANNKGLGNAKNTKFDEFFTQLSEIEKELKHYKEYFKDKIIFCNCDDPETSNFWLYFQLNFFSFEIKKLVSTHYEKGKVSYKLEIIKANITEDGQLRIPSYIKTSLEEDGDFRSKECIEILKEADIIITNPPFSLFREYIAQLMEYEKKFIIIGNSNALHYKEIFPLIKNNKLWLGYKKISGGMDMIVPEKVFDESKVKKYKINEKGEKIVNIQGICWFTNISTKIRNETLFTNGDDLIFYKTYCPEDYPKYINYNAIEVGKVTDIPINYFGEMGVPDTFLQRYNPNEFEIIGLAESDLGVSIGVSANLTKEQIKEIKAENPSFRKGNPIFRDKNGKLQKPYSRIIIKRKKGPNKNEN